MAFRILSQLRTRLSDLRTTKVGKCKTQGSFKWWDGLLSHILSGVGVACLDGEERERDLFELFRQPTQAFDTTLLFAFSYSHRGLQGDTERWPKPPVDF